MNFSEIKEYNDCIISAKKLISECDNYKLYEIDDSLEPTCFAYCNYSFAICDTRVRYGNLYFTDKTFITGIIAGYKINHSELLKERNCSIINNSHGICQVLIRVPIKIPNKFEKIINFLKK